MNAPDPQFQKPQDDAALASRAVANGAAPAIELRGVTKLYSRTEQRAVTIKEGLLGSLERRGRTDVVTALDGLDLTIGRGESIGLIGPNGSGKTTLLRLIAGISRPTSGTVAIQPGARVMGLIELGAGFHPELTGEENIRLQGAIYGMDPDAIQSRVDRILAFADLRDFRHMAVKHYSSGMFVRLGFAIAVATEPDILLVDEVLAVGDMTFQERCLREIARLRERGTTLLLVTHYPEQAERACERIAWLERGRLRAQGPASRMLAEYHQDLLTRQYGESQGTLTPERMTLGIPGRMGSGEARIERVRILDGAGDPRTSFRRGEPITLEIDYTAQPGVEAVDLTIPLESHDGAILTLWRSERDARVGRPIDGRGRFRLELRHPNLLPRRYRLSIALSPQGNPWVHFDLLYKLYHFTIEPEPDWETIGSRELTPTLERLE